MKTCQVLLDKTAGGLPVEQVDGDTEVDDDGGDRSDQRVRVGIAAVAAIDQIAKVALDNHAGGFVGGELFQLAVKPLAPRMTVETKSVRDLRSTATRSSRPTSE